MSEEAASLAQRVEVIGQATLYLGDCRRILPALGKVDHILTDPPYSEGLHANYNSTAETLGDRTALDYKALTLEDVTELAALFHEASEGWVAWMCDHDLSAPIKRAMAAHGRAVFTPVPFVHPGRSARLSGDGPSSWTDYIMVSRTAKLKKWGTLPGAYLATKGWNDKARVGGKPTHLMRLLVRDYTRSGELVCDPFMGAGTTGIACNEVGRRFIGIEIDPAAFEVSCERIRAGLRQVGMFDALEAA